MTRDEAEDLVGAELTTCLGLITELRGHRPQNATLQRTVRSIVQRLVNEGALHLEEENRPQ